MLNFIILKFKIPLKIKSFTISCVVSHMAEDFVDCVFAALVKRSKSERVIYRPPVRECDVERSLRRRRALVKGRVPLVLSLSGCCRCFPNS
jgi:hypothetical protein